MIYRAGMRSSTARQWMGLNGTQWMCVMPMKPTQHMTQHTQQPPVLKFHSPTTDRTCYFGQRLRSRLNRHYLQEPAELAGCRRGISAAQHRTGRASWTCTPDAWVISLLMCCESYDSHTRTPIWLLTFKNVSGPCDFAHVIRPYRLNQFCAHDIHFQVFWEAFVATLIDK